MCICNYINYLGHSNKYQIDLPFRRDSRRQNELNQKSVGKYDVFEKISKLKNCLFMN